MDITLYISFKFMIETPPYSSWPLQILQFKHHKSPHFFWWYYGDTRLNCFVKKEKPKSHLFKNLSAIIYQSISIYSNFYWTNLFRQETISRKQKSVYMLFELWHVWFLILHLHHHESALLRKDDMHFFFWSVVAAPSCTT